MKRPGGLITLAVFNFVFALPALVAAYAIYDIETHGLFGGEDRSFFEASAASQVTAAAALAIALLLVVSGIGYLRGRRISGRFAGNLFVALSLVTAAIALREGSGTWKAIVMSCALYPVLTGVLINSRYRPALAQ